MRTIDLEWHGPLRIPRLPSTRQLETQLAKPGVYIYLRKYPRRGLTVAYAGRAGSTRNNLMTRFRTHFVSTLGLGYWIYDENSCYAYRTKELCESLNDVDNKVLIAIEEVKRIQFYYTCIDDQFTKQVESLLIDQLMRRAEDNPRLKCDNERSVSYPRDLPPVTFQNKGAREIIQLLGVKRLQQKSDVT